jgi:hypothetical protein
MRVLAAWAVISGCGFAKVDSGVDLAAGDLTADDLADDLPPLPPDLSRCSVLDDCPAGFNCVATHCVAAASDCSAMKALLPGGGAGYDGVYWITNSGVTYRAYCDMQLGVELCSENMGEHTGQARDGSMLRYRMTSQLFWQKGWCNLWNVRDATSSGFPLDRVTNQQGFNTNQTCQVLGFISDNAVDVCFYGSGSGGSNCGYTVPQTSRWGNFCNGCGDNNGYFNQYTLQGVFTDGTVLSSADGSVVARCNVR